MCRIIPSGGGSSVAGVDGGAAGGPSVVSGSGSLGGSTMTGGEGSSVACGGVGVGSSASAMTERCTLVAQLYQECRC